MSRVSHVPEAALGHQASKASIAASDATYYSFYTVDLHEPGSPPRKRPAPASVNAATVPHHPIPETTEEHVSAPVPASQKGEMRRQDSGYESLPRRASESSRRRASGSSTSTTTPSGSAPPPPRQRTRPSMNRAKKSTGSARASSSSLYLARTNTQSQNLLPYLAAQTQQAAGSSFFQFPTPGLDHLHQPGHETIAAVVPFQPSASPDPFGVNPPQNPHPGTHALALCPTPHAEEHDDHSPERERAYAQSPRPPPQTTHYWTSDRTRRLEYAAIDAASRGVRGWILRHVVPDCIIPRENRRLGFEDDRGSVRRYRLQLEDEKDAPGVDSEVNSEEQRRRHGPRTWIPLKLWGYGKEGKTN